MSVDERRELKCAVVLAAAVWSFMLSIVGCGHKEPTQVLPAPGEHSVLVESQK